MVNSTYTRAELKARVEEQRAISKLGEIALSGEELSVVLKTAVEDLARVLNVKYVKVLELLRSEKQFAIRAGIGWKKKYLKSEYRVEASKKTHAGYTLFFNKAVIVDDLRKEKRFVGNKILHDHGIRSGIGVIIRGTGRNPYGIISVHSTEPKVFSKHDITFIQSIANIIGLYIQRRDTERFLNLNQERFEHAQKAGKIGIFDWDILNNSLWWSDEQAVLFGYETGYQPGIITSFREKVYPPDLEKIHKDIAEAKKNKTDYRGDFRIIHKDGCTKWIGARGKFYFDRKGNAVRLLGVNYDITERKRFEDSLVFLAESSKTLSSSLDIHKTLQSVSEIAVPRMADWCAVDLFNSSGDLELVGLSHSDPKKVKWARELRKKDPPDLKAPTGLPQVLRTGKPEFYPLVTDEMIHAVTQDEKKLKLIKKIGFTSVIIAPLKIKNKIIGAITFVTAESKTRYTKTDLRIAEQIADRASLAIENSLLYQDVNMEKIRLSNLVSNVPGVVWEIWGSPHSTVRRVGFISDYVKKMVGYSPSEWYKNPGFGLTIIHEEDRERASDEINEIFKKKDGGTIRFRWIKKSGDVLWVESHVFIVKKEGKPIGMRGVIMDITDRMEIEERKDEFISMASHELKTPITSAKVFSHLLAKDIRNGRQKSDLYLSKVDDQIDKLSNLVNDLLDISKIQAGKLELRRKRISLKRLIEDAVEDMRIITNEEIIVKNVGNLEIIGDKDRLSQVLVNLLSNAIKYSPVGAPVEVGSKIQGDKITVYVKDHGFGISKDHQSRIFERFYRVYDDIDKTFPGMGMGLYISSQIIQKHKGQIWLNSRLGKGSVFYFSIPIDQKN